VDWFGLASGKRDDFFQEKLADLVGGSLLVGLGRSVVLVLLGLVPDGITSGLEASADAGVVVLGDLLVGLLGSLVGGALELVRDVVAGLLDGIHFG
jgi:uncharacterized ion transporter superfamily protein YfcC